MPPKAPSAVPFPQGLVCRKTPNCIDEMAVETAVSGKVRRHCPRKAGRKLLAVTQNTGNSPEDDVLPGIQGGVGGNAGVKTATEKMPGELCGSWGS